MPPYSD